jgi:hypothetical protein
MDSFTEKETAPTVESDNTMQSVRSISTETEDSQLTEIESSRGTPFRGPWGSVSDENANDNQRANKRIQCAGNMISVCE